MADDGAGDGPAWPGASASVSVSPPRTVDEAMDWFSAAGVVEQQPIAVMLPGKVIKLTGSWGLFNPAPLINEGWMEGRMTQQEWVAFIESINAYVLGSMLDEARFILSRMDGWLRANRVMDRPLQVVSERAFACVRASLASCQQWWKDNRGINIQFQAHPMQVGNGRSGPDYAPLVKVDFPCDLLFAVLDTPMRTPPIMIQQQQQQQPPPPYPYSNNADATDADAVTAPATATTTATVAASSHPSAPRHGNADVDVCRT